MENPSLPSPILRLARRFSVGKRIRRGGMCGEVFGLVEHDREENDHQDAQEDAGCRMPSHGSQFPADLNCCESRCRILLIGRRAGELEKGPATVRGIASRRGAAAIPGRRSERAGLAGSPLRSVRAGERHRLVPKPFVPRGVRMTPAVQVVSWLPQGQWRTRRGDTASSCAGGRSGGGRRRRERAGPGGR